jgi:hypothetical protein
MKKFYLFIILGFILFLWSNPIFGQPLGEWKISRFWTEPACYTKLPNKDTTITVKAAFQCIGEKISKCQDLTIKAYWDSSIEHTVREINLTKAVISTCGPSATACTVLIDGEKMDVRILSINQILISKTGFISPRLTGNIKLTLEAYTGKTLTDKKIIIVKPCEQTGQAKPDLIVERFELPEIFTLGPDKMADIKGVLVVKNAGSAPSSNCYVDIVFEETKTHRKGSNRIPVPSLNPGATYSITTTLIRLPEGNYKVCAFLDSTNLVAESNETNNTTCRNLRVR